MRRSPPIGREGHAIALSRLHLGGGGLPLPLRDRPRHDSRPGPGGRGPRGPRRPAPCARRGDGGRDGGRGAGGAPRGDRPAGPARSRLKASLWHDPARRVYLEPHHGRRWA
ncbi:hypothetical protein FLW53_03020 [Microbispora sp. SCL1-1]|nr:hypothetical protein FLW53_03020 [Microbispora sp. SCL1-1]